MYDVSPGLAGETILGGRPLPYETREVKLSGKKRRILSLDLPTGTDDVVEVLLAEHYSCALEHSHGGGPSDPYELFLVHDIQGGWLRKWGTHRPTAFMFWTTPGKPGSLELPPEPLVGVRIYIPRLRLRLPSFLPDINLDDLREIELPQPILPLDYFTEPGPAGKPVWRRLRKGVAATRRRAEVCQHANNRYLDALAAARTGERMEPLLTAISVPVQRHGRRHRELRPWGEDAALLTRLARGECLLNGFRNRDLRAALSMNPTPPDDPAHSRKAAARVSRKIALLRAHGLVRKVSCTHRYLLTAKGTKLCTAVLHLNQAEIQDVVNFAA